MQVLYDCQDQKEILRDVARWSKFNKVVLLAGYSRGTFVVLHIDTGLTESYSDLDSTPARLRPSFEALRRANDR